MQPMRQRMRRRVQGEHSPKGESKRKLITYIFDHPEGCEYENLRNFLEDEVRIREKGVLDKHLNYFKKNGLLIAPVSDDPDIWKPLEDIDSIKKLWNDEILSNAPSEDQHNFLLTKQFQRIIETIITPALVDLNFSPTFKGNQMYQNLKNVASQQERQELESVCQWACQFSPILISHLFKPRKEVLMCIVMSLNEFLMLPKKGTIISTINPSSAVNLSKTFREVIDLVMEDWYKIRFSDKVSKELICILTIITCLFFQTVEERDLADRTFKSKEFSKVWELFRRYTADIENTNPNVNIDIFKIMFTVRFANEITL